VPRNGRSAQPALRARESPRLLRDTRGNLNPNDRALAAARRV